MRSPAGMRLLSYCFNAASVSALPSSASVSASASCAAFATPAPICGRATNAASPRIATRPNAMCGRVAILGDAAFVARPHIGAGVAKAAQDALALAEALDGSADTEAALKQYESRRIPAGERIIARARHLGAYVQADLKTDAEREYAARHRTPEAVLAETAMMDF